MTAPLSGRVTQGSFADALRRARVEPTATVTMREPTGFDVELSW